MGWVGLQKLDPRPCLWPCRPVERRQDKGGGGKLLRAPRQLSGPPSLKNTNYGRMHHFRQKKLTNFLPREAPRECFLGPRCGSRRPWARIFHHFTTWNKRTISLDNSPSVFVANLKLFPTAQLLGLTAVFAPQIQRVCQCQCAQWKFTYLSTQ